MFDFSKDEKTAVVKEMVTYKLCMLLGGFEWRKMKVTNEKKPFMYEFTM